MFRFNPSADTLQKDAARNVYRVQSRTVATLRGVVPQQCIERMDFSQFGKQCEAERKDRRSCGAMNLQMQPKPIAANCNELFCKCDFCIKNFAKHDDPLQISPLKMQISAGKAGRKGGRTHSLIITSGSSAVADGPRKAAKKVNWLRGLAKW